MWHPHRPCSALQPPLGLTNSQAVQLQAWLPPGGSHSPSDWREVYRATKHGFGAADFHARCDRSPRLLVLVRERDGGSLFGGYTSVGFSPHASSFYADPAAFLFSLTNLLGHPEKLESLGSGDDLFYADHASASFGDGCGLHICGDANTVAGSYVRTGLAYAESASTGSHPMAHGRQSGWRVAEVVAWVV